ncbi:hypothetical protein ACIP5Y_06755 [Nocardia sp. NPDC088792]|uniref:hypothetical protein n=1 Tax=Nocardia sp. NPDC088792 TaxID=3364332 RepID=UPI0038307FC5
MKFTKTALLIAAASTTMAITAGTSHAAPQEVSDTPTGVDVTASATDESAIISTDAGSLTVENGTFKIKSPEGITLAGTELNFRVDDFEFPIAAEISDRTATLTPQFDLAHAVYKPVALPFEDKAPWKNEYDREVSAWTRLTSTISMGATLGTLVGGLSGAAIGCVAGGLMLGTAASAVTGIIGAIFAFLPGAAIGCLVGVAAVGAIGTILGHIFISAPIALGAAIQYFTTVNTPLPGK